MFVIAVGSKFWCTRKMASGEQSRVMLAVPGQYGLQALRFETGSAAAQWARRVMDDPDGVKFRILEKLDNAQVTEFHGEAPQMAATKPQTTEPSPKVHRKKRKVNKARRKANG